MSPNFVFSWPNAVRCADAPHNVMEAVKAVSVALSFPSACTHTPTDCTYNVHTESPMQTCVACWVGGWGCIR